MRQWKRQCRFVTDLNNSPISADFRKKNDQSVIFTKRVPVDVRKLKPECSKDVSLFSTREKLHVGSCIEQCNGTVFKQIAAVSFYPKLNKLFLKRDSVSWKNRLGDVTLPHKHTNKRSGNFRVGSRDTFLLEGIKGSTVTRYHFAERITSFEINFYCTTLMGISGDFCTITMMYTWFYARLDETSRGIGQNKPALKNLVFSLDLSRGESITCY